ncbi:MAG: aminotransferase class I/II-fold pyridoxal phosphate-dependent enzyme, partial [Balneolaceae bacterium]
MNFGSDSQYEKEIEQRKRLHRLRTLSPVEQNGSRTRIVYKEQSCVNFCSNDYLGLATHPHVLQRASEWTFALGAGSSASRLISGTTNEHIALEERIAHFTGWEAALLFGSGYLANATLIPALVGREDGILVDRMAHNSILHGCKASNGRFRRFRHNNMNHLEDLIRNSVETFRTTWVITETLFSMDGDESPLEDLVSLCKKYGVRLYLDDAHSFGVMGDQGKGLGAETVGADLVLATLGKAAGGYGAFALLSETLREYLINRCGGFIYTTSLPPSILGAADAALDLIPAMNRERCKLFEFATLFREAVLKA